MSTGQVAVTFVRPGKQPKTVLVASGSTLRSALDYAEIASADYNGWSFTDEDGDTLTLNDAVSASTQIICGGRVDGAH
jgi:hypothetical protein